MTATLIGAGRGAFDSGAKTLTFSVPAIARKGDVLLVLVAHNTADVRGATPSGWAFVTSFGAGADVLDVYSRMVDEGEPSSVSFSLLTVANEWQGELVLIRGASPGTLLEASNSIGFTATTSLTTAIVTSQQAISLILIAWTCSGAPALTLPAGFTSVDSFNTAVVSSRSMLVGYRIAGATGTQIFMAATTIANTTGRSFAMVLRAGPPTKPVGLVDLVPGNIGLIGKDTRPAR
jgi:hypothetical protein